jgi:hypothetical protein
MSFESNAIKDINISGAIGNMSLENSLKVETDRKRP